MSYLKIAIVFNTQPKMCRYAQKHPDIYVPIIGGGDTLNRDLKVDLPNTHFDNEGENISWLNPYLNEITAIYWLGKHLDKIGNPLYVGLHHYRRLFLLEDFYHNLAPDTLVLNYEKMMLPMVDFLELCHGMGYQFLEIANRALRMDLPLIKNLFQEYIDGWYSYTRNLFVVPSEVLLKLVQYIDLILPHIVKDINYDLYGTPGGRNMGFIMERLVGFYFFVLVKTHQYKPHHVMFRYVDPEELK